LKLKADKSLGVPSGWRREVAYVPLLGLTGWTGLALYGATGTALVAPLLALHLGAALAFFLTAPYSKMVHGFYRGTSLVRDTQRKHT